MTDQHAPQFELQRYRDVETGEEGEAMARVTPPIPGLRREVGLLVRVSQIAPPKAKGDK